MKQKFAVLIAICLSIVMSFGVFACGTKDDDEYQRLDHELTGISLSGEYKTSYTVGESFDKTGLIVTAEYADGVNETLDAGDYRVDPAGALALTDNKITVMYSGFKAYIDITVSSGGSTPGEDPVDPGDPGQDPGTPSDPTVPGDPTPSDKGSISVTKMPNKTSYFIGETFDKTGMTVMYVPKTGGGISVTNYTLSVTTITKDLVHNNKVVITVTYDGMTCEFTVDAREPGLESIEIKTQPTKRAYYIDETFDPTGMVVEATYEDGTQKPVTGYTLAIGEVTDISEYKLQATDTEIDVIYFEGGETRHAVVTITITAAGYTGLTIDRQPTRTSYIEGEKFDPTGLIVKANYINGSSKPVTGYTLSIGAHTDLDSYDLTVADTEVTVTYTDDGTTHTATIDITVVAVTLTGLRIVDMPDKTTYMVGENFDSTGLTVQAVYNNDESFVRDIDGWTVTDGNALAFGKTFVTVSYNSKTVNVPIAVLQKFKFEAEVLTTEGGTTPDVRYGFEYSSTRPRTMISGIGMVANMAKVSSFVLNVYAESECDAILGMCVARHNANAGTAETISTILSGISIGANNYTIYPEAAVYGNAGGMRYFDFCEADCASIHLSAGNNVIKINMTGSTSRNWDYVTIKAPVAVEFSAEHENGGHAFTDWTISTMPTDAANGEMYRYCPLCGALERVTMPADLADTSKYTLVSEAEATDTANGIKTYTLDGKTFTVITDTVYKINNTFDLEDATRNTEYNTKYGINYNAPVTTLNDTHGASAENFNTRGGGEYDFTIYSPAAVSARVALRLYNSDFSPSCNVLLSVNGKHYAISEAIVTSASGWQYVDIADIALVAGENTLVLQMTAGTFTYVDDMIVRAPVTLVTSADKLVKSIAVTTSPTKLTYALGDSFNPAGMVITATREDNTTFVVTQYNIYADLDHVGQIDVTVWAENKQATVTVTVEDIHVTSLTVTHAPNKTDYLEGETFDPTGMTVEATYNDGSKADVALGDLTFDVDVFTGGETAIGVSHGGASTSVNVHAKYVTVLEAEGAVWTGNATLFAENDNISGVARASNWKNTTATFDFYVDAAAQIKLYAVFAGIEHDAPYTNYIASLTIDGASLDVPTTSFTGHSWSAKFTAELANFNVTAGEHRFVIQGATQSNSNFDFIRLISDGAKVIWADEKETGKVWCDWVAVKVPTATVSGKIMRQSAHGDLEMIDIPADLTNNKYTHISGESATEFKRGYSIYSYNGIQFKIWEDMATGTYSDVYFCAADAKISTREGATNNFLAEYWRYGKYSGINNTQNTVTTYEIFAEHASTMELYAVLTAYGDGVTAEQHRMFGASINGVPVLVSRNGAMAIANTNDFDSFTNMFMGTIDLVEGKNTLVFEIFGGCNKKLNFSGIKLRSTAGVAWTGEVLELVTAPTKTVYGIGDSFDPTGMVLRVKHRTYKNSYNASAPEFTEPTRNVISGYTVDDGDALQLGRTSVTVRYDGLTVNVPIKVYYPDIESIAVSGQVTHYALSDSVQPGDFTLKGTRTGGGQVDITSEFYSISTTAWQVGTVTVTVTYTYTTPVQTSYNITVAADQLTFFQAECFEIDGFTELCYEHENGAYSQSAETAAVGTWVTSYNTAGGTMTFRPYNSEAYDVIALLDFRHASNTTKKDFSVIFSSLKVNGVEVPLTSKNAASGNGWHGYVLTGGITRIRLQPGENEIVLTASGTQDSNLDSVALTTCTQLVSTSCKDGHSYTDWYVLSQPTDQNAGRKYRYCTACGEFEFEDIAAGSAPVATLTPGTSNSVYADLTQAKVTTDEGRTYNPDYNESNGTYASGQFIVAKYEYKITASAAGAVKLELCVSDGSYLMGRIFKLEVNGVMIAMDWNVRSGTDMNNVVPGKTCKCVTLTNIQLNAGENTIRLVNYGARMSTVYGIYLTSDLTLTPVANA